MDFVGGGGNGGLGSENGPILYNEPNRTSAIDDIRSVVIYIFIITIFISFFLILPGIRSEKFPTFLCITTSLIVTSIILVSLFGTTWHVGEAPISAAYKAFSRDRIQGDLSVKIGLQSVNITLRAHKYYILHDIQGPMIMYNTKLTSSAAASPEVAAKFSDNARLQGEKSSLADELLVGRTSDGATVDTELEVDEVFADSKEPPNRRTTRSSNSSKSNSTINKREATSSSSSMKPTFSQKFTIERVNVDINYNERFYWIEPNQMRQEHHNALERGLPYPILTVVEYLSQDEAGFSWSRQYRAAGYYSYIILWLSLCVCALMFFLHCAAPKYGIYTMQILGCLLLFTNFTYATLVPKGDRKLVIPFEGQSLTLQFGWSFWLVLIGGCLSFVVGTIIVIVDRMFPNFIFTTILDVDFDSHHNYYKHKPHRTQKSTINQAAPQRPVKPPFFKITSNSSSSSTTSSTSSSTSSNLSSTQSSLHLSSSKSSSTAVITSGRHRALKVAATSPTSNHNEDSVNISAPNEHLIVGPLIKKRPTVAVNSFTPIEVHESGSRSSSEEQQISNVVASESDKRSQDHYGGEKKVNLKSMHQQAVVLAAKQTARMHQDMKKESLVKKGVQEKEDDSDLSHL